MTTNAGKLCRPTQADWRQLDIHCRAFFETVNKISHTAGDPSPSPSRGAKVYGKTLHVFLAVIRLCHWCGQTISQTVPLSLYLFSLAAGHEAIHARLHAARRWDSKTILYISLSSLSFKDSFGCCFHLPAVYRALSLLSPAATPGSGASSIRTVIILLTDTHDGSAASAPASTLPAFDRNPRASTEPT